MIHFGDVDPMLRENSSVVGAYNDARFGGGIRQGIILSDSSGIRWGIPIVMDLVKTQLMGWSAADL